MILHRTTNQTEGPFGNLNKQSIGHDLLFSNRYSVITLNLDSYFTIFDFSFCVNLRPLRHAHQFLRQIGFCLEKGIQLHDCFSITLKAWIAPWIINPMKRYLLKFRAHNFSLCLDYTPEIPNECLREGSRTLTTVI